MVWKEARDVNKFICWVRLCQAHREYVARKRNAASAAEQGMPGSLPSWLGGLELSEDENTECFKLTIKHILETQLTSAQRRESHYQWDSHGTIGPSRKARSLHDAIVRKYLGHKNTAHHIYQHGLPRLFARSGRRVATRRVLDLHRSARRRPATAAEHRDLDQPTDNPSEVQAALAEAAHWLVTLVSAICSRKDDARMPVLRMLGARPENLSPEQRQQRQSRKASIREIAEKFPHAKMLAKDWDDGKRAFDNMSAADQQLLEDFDTERLHKRRRLIVADRLPSFRSQVSSASAAAEHANYQ